MTGSPHPSGAPDLAIRSAPAPVRRFSKKALALLLGGAGALVLGSFALAMKPKDRAGPTSVQDLYSTTNKPQADGLSSLPGSYADVESRAPVREVPVLGPPLPGDLGAPILKAQREGRYTFEQDPLAAKADGDEASDRVQELAAERAIAARESGLFFSNAADGGTSPVDSGLSKVAPNAVRDPFEVLNALNLNAAGSELQHDANFQARKEDFISQASDDAIYNPYRLETPVSPWQVMSGTVIPATLLTGINSDLPGQVIAQVTEPVYDTVTGRTVLIPQGSRIIGRYDSVVAYGQSRALVVWNRIIMPDGSSIRIENLPGVDARGNAGLKDRVDNHTLRIFSAAALSSLISIGAELSDDDDDRIARALRDATQEGASQVGNEVIRRQLAVQPTITVRPGWRLRILVHQDIILKPYGAQ
jgi:type IV secretion system protein VirB10